MSYENFLVNTLTLTNLKEEFSKMGQISDQAVIGQNLGQLILEVKNSVDFLIIRKFVPWLKEYGISSGDENFKIDLDNDDEYVKLLTDDRDIDNKWSITQWYFRNMRYSSKVPNNFYSVVYKEASKITKKAKDLLSLVKNGKATKENSSYKNSKSMLSHIKLSQKIKKDVIEANPGLKVKEDEPVEIVHNLTHKSISKLSFMTSNETPLSVNFLKQQRGIWTLSLVSKRAIINAVPFTGDITAYRRVNSPNFTGED